MKRFDPSFPNVATGIDFDTLEGSEYSIYALTADLKFIYFNPAFFQFTEENDIADNYFDTFGIGSSFSEVLKGDKVKQRYISAYENVLDSGDVLHHEYECSSGTQYRYFHQGVFPFKNGDGLIVINSLMVNLPVNQLQKSVFDAQSSVYLGDDGFIVQCSNCRHVQRVKQPDVWYWVPD